MPPNSIVKDSIVIGGLTLLGYMAGGKLGSMFGAVIGTVVCSMFNVEQPTRTLEPSNDTHRYTPYPSNTNASRGIRRRKINKIKEETSKCSICLESFKPTILLLPCAHTCFCDDCFGKVKRRNISNCPMCREHIEEFLSI